VAQKPSVVNVIDDDESVRRVLVRLLRSADLDAETFSSADEFLKGPMQNKNSCILIDIQMPGSTGFDLQQELATFDIRMPVIVISTSDDAFIREHARELGAVSFFRKPVDDQALLDGIWWAISGAKKNKLYAGEAFHLP
jgi:FixJ family two-component response regulator